MIIAVQNRSDFPNGCVRRSSMVFSGRATICIDWIVERGNYQIAILRKSGVHHSRWNQLI